MLADKAIKTLTAQPRSGPVMIEGSDLHKVLDYLEVLKEQLKNTAYGVYL